MEQAAGAASPAGPGGAALSPAARLALDSSAREVQRRAAGVGTAAQRLKVVQSHLPQGGRTMSPPPPHHPPTPPSGGGAAAAAQSTAMRRLRWMAPTLGVLVAVGGGARAAWKRRADLVSKAVPLGMKAAMWVMQQRMGGGGDTEAVPRQRQLESILRAGETATHGEMKRLHDRIREELPLERQLQAMRRSGLTDDEKEDLWFDFEVSVLGRMVAGVYCLCLVHFVTSAAHALHPCPGSPRVAVLDDDTNSGSSETSECSELLAHLDLKLLLRTVGASCRAALRGQKVDRIRATCTAAKIESVVREVRRAVDEELGLPAEKKSGGEKPPQRPLHEVVLGEERVLPADGSADGAHEPRLEGKLRDLLDDAESQRLLRSSLDQLFAVVHQHCAAAVAQALGLTAGCDSDLLGKEVKVTKLFPKLSPELNRICERNNEFVLSLKAAEQDSVWDTFFLDLFQLQSETVVPAS
eukprot:TRINITY_DN47320_c0_g1_i1.p1 TRINITY_DN47320_c0_g1~~TRINITY_DN47320_c0_g1_i1.p1  ORF type:complete len:500 (+),score=157.29 TRINITY_DN47320_c0_g1_i1:97-1500(+)